MIQCKKCGNEIEEGNKFCSHCGARLENFELTNGFTKGLVAYYVQLFVSPVIFIIRMLSQQIQRIDGGWKHYDAYVVPGNIKAIMYVLLSGAVLFAFSCRGKEDPENKKKILYAKILSIVNVFVSILIINMPVEL